MTEKIWNSKFIVYCLLFIVHFKTHIMSNENKPRKKRKFH